MFSFLNKPYPQTENFRKSLIVGFCVGAFVAFFLIVFQPFNISLWLDPAKNLKLAGFGLVSFVCSIFLSACLLFVPASEKEDNWKVWKEILVIICIVLLIAGGNLFYSDLIGIGSISLKGYFRFILITFSVGIFPIALSVIVKYNRFLKLNQKNATEINTILDEKPVAVPTAASNEIRQLVLIAENEKDKLEMPWQQLLYIESADNYSQVHYLEGETPRKTLVRGSLKRMEQQCQPFSEIARCHRAYIVNLSRVSHVDGNAAGYKLSLKNTQTQVPVSRNFGGQIIEKLKDKG